MYGRKICGFLEYVFAFLSKCGNVKQSCGISFACRLRFCISFGLVCERNIIVSENVSQNRVWLLCPALLCVTKNG